jgi:hypothetical protein
MTDRITRCRECGSNEIHAKGYCQKHYRQLKKHGEMRPEKEKGFWKGKKCAIEWCTSYKVHAKGYCSKHYKQVRSGITPRPTSEKAINKVCLVSGCEDKVKALSHCSRHYQQIKNNSGKIKRTHRHRGTCFIFACLEVASSKGLCPKHYQSYKKRFIDKGESWRTVHLGIVAENNSEMKKLISEYDTNRDRTEELINLEIMTEALTTEE